MTPEENYQVERQLVRDRCAEYRARLIAERRIRPNRLNTPIWLELMPYLPEHDA